jgi:hypothetical protein
LRRYYQGADEFPNDVMELLQYFEQAAPGQQVRAVPGAGVEVEAWILGSSLFGAPATVFDPAARMRSFELAAGVFSQQASWTGMSGMGHTSSP